jgi:two-component system, chemotaxis family, sensor kinase CheA
VDTAALDAVAERATQVRIMAVAGRQVIDRIYDLARLAEDGLHEPQPKQVLAVLATMLRRVAVELEGGQRRLIRSAEEQLEKMLSLQLQPMRGFLLSFARYARELARSLKREVEVELEGEETRLDRRIARELEEALLHLVRNAVDHGIEAAAERRAAGKPERGAIGMKAYHQGNQVVVEISDDGRGIDSGKVLAKAVERGMLTAEEAGQMDDSQVADLIFRPGFSTADRVTAISGRGVGMDIVQAVMHRLKGTVSIVSRRGAGSTIFLKVPLTLAIIKALMFRVDEHLYALPLNTVAEIARSREAEVHRVDGHEVLQLRKDVLTLLRVGRRHQQEDQDRKFFVVTINVGDRKFGLMVDDLVGEEELVIKPLDDHVVATDLVSGASILGNGTVVLVLNLGAVVERFARRRAPESGTGAGLLTPRSLIAAATAGGGAS